ncbi:MAG TPA: BatA and WFA domain-containing protein [Chitinophagales bacterium]|nr:BatA and WFA domain-containing protein [Chitinophagales bacterium]
MNFTYPAFLFATVAIAIPIIIHLFNFRKFKTIYFSNVRFLKEVKQETQSRSKLRNFLILACRILAVLFLVFAFAQPYIPVKNKKIIPGQKSVSIFIDNSFSMEAVNKNGTLLDEAKKKALEILSSYKPNDRFQILTNDFEGKHQRLVNKEEFNTLLDEINISPATRSLPEILARQKDVLQSSGNGAKVAYILSDFQKSIVKPDQLKNDTTIDLNFIPLTAAIRNNIYIDTCWFDSPVRQLNKIENLHVRIKNRSDKMVENNSIKLFINGIQRTLASFSIEENNQTEVILSFPNKESGSQQCYVILNDYPVTFDDTFYFSYEVAENVSVLSINVSGADEVKSQGPYITQLFGTDSLFVLKNAAENKLEYSLFPNYNLIILHGLQSISSGLTQELKRFADNGGSVLVFPSPHADLAEYKAFFEAMNARFYEGLDTADTKVEKINLEHPVYKDVFDKKTFQSTNLDLPKIYSHYSFSPSVRTAEENLLRLQNGDPFLSRYKVEKGNLYVCAVPLNTDFSNFAKHALFVPTMYMIAINSQLHQPLFYTIGKDEHIETTKLITGENVYHIQNESTHFDVIPEHKILDMNVQINIHNQISEGGNYYLYAGKEKIMPLSFNFNRVESDLACYTKDDLQALRDTDQLANVHILNSGEKSMAAVIDLDEGKKLWKWCIFFTLLFLAFETLLLRLRPF